MSDQISSSKIISRINNSVDSGQLPHNTSVVTNPQSLEEAAHADIVQGEVKYVKAAA